MASVLNTIMFYVMWNTEFSGAESELKDQAVEALRERLPPLVAR